MNICIHCMKYHAPHLVCAEYIKYIEEREGGAMNKKLESAMEVAAIHHADVIIPIIANNVLSIAEYKAFKAGFQKCHEIMAQREAKLVEALNKIMSDEEEYSPTFFKLEKALKEREE